MLNKKEALKQLQEHRNNLPNTKRSVSSLLKERIELETNTNTILSDSINYSSTNIKDYITHLEFHENVDFNKVPYIIRQELREYARAFKLIIDNRGLEKVMYLINHGTRLVQSKENLNLLKDSVDKYFSIFDK